MQKRSRLVAHFNKFRESKLFFDCHLKCESRRYPAHRIVLSQYSTLFRDYFKVHSSTDGDMEVPVPFDTQNLFSTLLDFMYTEQVKVKPSTETPLLALAKIYGVKGLENIISSSLKDSISKDTILGYVRPFLSFSLPPSAESMFPGITLAFENMLKEGDVLSDYIAEVFDELPLQSIYKSVTPQMFAKVLSMLNYDDYPNEKRMKMICDFVEVRNLKPGQAYDLENVIRWDDPRAYLLFANFNADWVSPGIARPFYDIILENRRQTFAAFQQVADSTADCISGWFTYSWVNCIRQSEAHTELPLTEITHFAATLGGATGHEVSPDYGFVFTNFSTASSDSPPGQVPDDVIAKCDIFNWKNMLSDNNMIYKSKVCLKEQPYIGIRFTGSKFNPTNADFIYRGRTTTRVGALRPFVSIDGKDTLVGEPFKVQDTEVSVAIEQKHPVVSFGFTTQQEDMTSLYSILRCERFRVFGYFSPDCVSK